jgi:hypothetical protein
MGATPSAWDAKNLWRRESPCSPPPPTIRVCRDAESRFPHENLSLSPLPLLPSRWKRSLRSGWETAPSPRRGLTEPFPVHSASPLSLASLFPLQKAQRTLFKAHPPVAHRVQNRGKASQQNLKLVTVTRGGEKREGRAREEAAAAI